jgi:hypothetical protein
LPAKSRDTISSMSDDTEATSRCWKRSTCPNAGWAKAIRPSRASSSDHCASASCPDTIAGGERLVEGRGSPRSSGSPRCPVREAAAPSPPLAFRKGIRHHPSRAARPPVPRRFTVGAGSAAGGGCARPWKGSNAQAGQRAPARIRPRSPNCQAILSEGVRLSEGAGGDPMVADPAERTLPTMRWPTSPRTRSCAKHHALRCAIAPRCCSRP